MLEFPEVTVNCILYSVLAWKELNALRTVTFWLVALNEVVFEPPEPVVKEKALELFISSLSIKVKLPLEVKAPVVAVPVTDKLQISDKSPPLQNLPLSVPAL